VTSTGCIGGLQYICGNRKFPGILLKFGFLIFCVIRRKRLSSNIGGFVLVGRVVFSLRIYEFYKVIEHKFVSHLY